MSRPLLLDLFCGAGGAAMGYSRAGFNVVGVDIEPQPHYPFRFLRSDALEVLKMNEWTGYAAIHASPPCQAYSVVTPDKGKHPDLVESVRQSLVQTGLPYIIENVPGAPLRNPVMLCGSSFGLKVRRHRLFETNWPVMSMPCIHGSQGTPLGVYGDGGPGKSTRPSGGGGTKADRRDFKALMDMPWAIPAEITQAIPPAYTEFIGEQLLEHIRGL